MRFLPPPMDLAPSSSGPEPDEMSVDSLEPNPQQSLFDRLHQVAIESAPEYMKQALPNRTHIRPDHLPILLLRVQGFTYTEIASMLGLSRFTVSQVLRSPAGQALLTKLYVEAGLQAADVGRAFVEAAPMAADVLVELAQDGVKEETRLKAAFSILDRAGYGAIKKNESLHKVEVQHNTVAHAELLELRDALREAIEVEAEFEIVEQEPTPEAEDAA